MGRIAEVDAYIAKRADFARPILTHIRDVAHKAAPLDEAIKWGMPSFTHKGKIVLGMAAFKAHAVANFWYGELVTGGTGREAEAMGSFGRIVSLDDLPDDALIADFIARTLKLIDAGVVPSHMANRNERPELPVPGALQAAIDADAAAKAVWDKFAPSAKRDYSEWIGEARRDETRAARLAQAVEWIGEGKRRHWKSERPR